MHNGTRMLSGVINGSAILKSLLQSAVVEKKKKRILKGPPSVNGNGKEEKDKKHKGTGWKGIKRKLISRDENTM